MAVQALGNHPHLQQKKTFGLDGHFIKKKTKKKHNLKHLFKKKKFIIGEYLILKINTVRHYLLANMYKRLYYFSNIFFFSFIFTAEKNLHIARASVCLSHVMHSLFHMKQESL